jgi:2-aminoadipate transaminase
MPRPPLLFSLQAKRTSDSPITYFIEKALSTPGLISFAAGLVDEPSLPVAEVQRAAEQLLSDPKAARAALQYGSTQGLPSLREKILDLVCQADQVPAAAVNLNADDVLITTGSQQFLYLLGEALLDPGDIVITEAPRILSTTVPWPATGSGCSRRGWMSTASTWTPSPNCCSDCNTRGISAESS